MKRSGQKRPGFFDAAFLLTRYRSEIRMLDIPAVVQKVAFPVLLAAGTLLGKYDRFKDAPEPVLETEVVSPHATRADQRHTGLTSGGNDAPEAPRKLPEGFRR